LRRTQCRLCFSFKDFLFPFIFYQHASFNAFFVYSKSEYTLKSVSVSVRPSVRPAVYTITPERLILSSWNFLHTFISSISRSSSKMRIIRLGFTELHQEISLSSMQILTYSNFRKSKFLSLSKWNLNYYISVDREFHGLQNDANS
jgi:hypothetical protein